MTRSETAYGPSSDPSIDERVWALTGMQPLRWASMTWPQIQALREAGPGLVVLPLGATEQHGPHLPTGTDTFIADAVSAYASAKTGVPVLPTLPITVSLGHTQKWDGTVSVMHETLMRYLRETVSWLVAKGWSRVLLINSHFGNDATLRCVVDRLRTDYLSTLQIGLANTYAVDQAIWQTFTADADDLHANAAETDLLLYLNPARVDQARLPQADDPDRTVAEGRGTVFSYPVSQTSTNGVTGTPSVATAARGEALFKAMGEAMADLFARAKTETPPLAIQDA